MQARRVGRKLACEENSFTSTATQHGGQDTTLFSIITNLLHFGMVVVGLDYTARGSASCFFLPRFC